MVIFHDPEVPPATVGAMITLSPWAVIVAGTAGGAVAEEEEEVEGEALLLSVNEEKERIILSMSILSILL